jgi:hypothetical protein
MAAQPGAATAQNTDSHTTAGAIDARPDGVAHAVGSDDRTPPARPSAVCGFNVTNSGTFGHEFVVFRTSLAGERTPAEGRTRR